jgi:hypothetical protein
VEDAGVVRLKDGNGRTELTPSSLEFKSIKKGERERVFRQK